MAAPRVKVYQPQVRVTLYKTVARTTLNGRVPTAERFQGLEGLVDLTPFLSEGSTVRTTKSVREAAGGFTVSFADQPYKKNGAFETLYGLIEPMDVIEIRMRHDAGASGGPVVVMRGFVSDVQRLETMGADGRPDRSVVVTGQDYGKIWQMLQILYLPGYVIGQDLLTNFRLFERFGAGFQTTMPAWQFTSEVIEKIVNPYLDRMMPENAVMPRAIRMDAEQQVKVGTTSVTGPQNQEGSVYDLVRTFGDVGIWNELFLEDREDGVYCVYRPNPARDITGLLISDDAVLPEQREVLAEDIVSLTLGRTDANVANFYWVRAPRFELANEAFLKLSAVQSSDRETVLLDEYPNSAQSLYGIRVMYGQTEQGPTGLATFNSGLPADDELRRRNDVDQWLRDRRRVMVEQNKDNVLLERGSMRIRGNERIRAGTYVILRRGSFTAEYYVTAVEHDFAPFRGFFTTLTVERGMGFVERVKREGGIDSPYLAELMRRPS